MIHIKKKKKENLDLKQLGLNPTYLPMWAQIVNLPP